MEESVYNALLKYAIDKEYQEGLTGNEIIVPVPETPWRQIGEKGRDPYKKIYFINLQICICKTNMLIFS